MGTERTPPQGRMPELPNSEPPVPVETVFELAPEPGSTFEVLAATRDRDDIAESGQILGIVSDERYAGGGYLGVRLVNTESSKSREGKLTFETFLHFYNDQRIANFTNPSDSTRKHEIAAISGESTSTADEHKGLREQIHTLRPDIDAQFASYLAELIEHNGIARMKEVASHMSDASNTYLREQMASGNLPGFIARMEMVLERATDPQWKEKMNRRVDDSLSGDSERVKRATRAMLERFHHQVELTSRHYRPKRQDNTIANEEIKDFLTKWLSE